MIDRIQKVLNRRQAYRRIFLDGDGNLTPDGEAVIRDLARFCRLHRSTSVVSLTTRQTDVPATFQAEGRREVILRILGHLHVDDADLVRLTEREAINE
jgi:hypothetical protein|nr:MAG TPA: hypothetical protein [Caudoviricetes sp.]